MIGNNGNGGGGSPSNWVIKWLSIVLAVAIAFVFTPLIHGATVDWVLGYMEENYGSWMVALGWFFWWIIVAMLTFLTSVLGVMTSIMLGQFFLFTMRSGGGGR
ncbi:hypothetical protein FPZ54_06690 [Sphingomonas suaedae]|uniref:Uncharacterized protein n=1 Tax=Sphingomonas suaedae TaxID=2599297 RepID=A0A518RE70_9SPHN|nr:hypothetical protein [Sphingomonas suaedae]QDX25736.1 hypothetical protein FPZ54_06690 [Sphingomonas suaedae]